VKLYRPVHVVTLQGSTLECIFDSQAPQGRSSSLARVGFKAGRGRIEKAVVGKESPLRTEKMQRLRYLRGRVAFNRRGAFGHRCWLTSLMRRSKLARRRLAQRELTVPRRPFSSGSRSHGFPTHSAAVLSVCPF